MELQIDRLLTVISLLYGHQAEVVCRADGEYAFLFLDGIPQYGMPIWFEEVDCLIDNGIIELDSGCDEPGHEETVYRLTDIAQQKMGEIILKHQPLRLR